MLPTMASLKVGQDLGVNGSQHLHIRPLDREKITPNAQHGKFERHAVQPDGPLTTANLHTQVWKKLAPNELWESLPALSKAFLVLSVSSSLLLFGFGISQIVTAREASLFLLVPFLLTTLGYLACVLDSFYRENSAELLGSAALGIVAVTNLLYYTVVQQRNTGWAVIVTTVLAAAQVGLCILTYAVYTQFGWRVYSKLACDYRIKDAEKRLAAYFQENIFRTFLQLELQFLTLLAIAGLLVGLNFTGSSVSVLLISSSAIGWLGATTWLGATYFSMRQKNITLARQLELLVPVTYVMPIIVATEGFGSVGREQQASVLLLCWAVLYGSCRTLAWSKERKLLEQLAKSGDLDQTSVSLAASRSVHPQLLSLMRGAWLGKPTAKHPRKRRFFQLSNDGSTLRWAWKKYILLYYVKEVTHDDAAKTLCLRMSMEPDLSLSFDEQKLYETWKTGLAVVLNLLLGPEDPTRATEGCVLDKDSSLRRTGSGTTFLRRLGSFPTTARASLIEPDRDARLQQAEQHAKSILKAARLFTDESSPQAIKAIMHNIYQNQFVISEDKAAHMRTNSTQETEISDWFGGTTNASAAVPALEEAAHVHQRQQGGSGNPTPAGPIADDALERKKSTCRRLTFSQPTANPTERPGFEHTQPTEIVGGSSVQQTGLPSWGLGWGLVPGPSTAELPMDQPSVNARDLHSLAGATAHVEVVVHGSDEPHTPRPAKLTVNAIADVQADTCPGQQDLLVWPNGPLSPGMLSSYLPTPMQSPWKDNEAIPDAFATSAFLCASSLPTAPMPSSSFCCPAGEEPGSLQQLNTSQSSISLSMSLREQSFRMGSRNPSQTLSSVSSFQELQPHPSQPNLAKTLSLQVPVEAIRYEDLAFGQFLGKGAEGFVYAAMYRDTPVAVKKTESLNELEMNLHAGSHDNIVALRGLCQHKGHMYLVMEYCPRGTLDVMLHKTSVHKFEPHKLLPIIRGIARGMYHLSSRSPPILHRDLKPANIFISRGFQAKVGDFGMSRALGVQEPTTLSRTLTPGVIGTSAYSAPELLAGEQAVDADAGSWLKADVFSFGVTLWEMLERKRPFEGLDNFQIQTQWILHPEEMRLHPVTVPEDAEPVTRKLLDALGQLVLDCTSIDPAKRPSFQEILLRLRSIQHTLGIGASGQSMGSFSDIMSPQCKTHSETSNASTRC